MKTFKVLGLLMSYPKPEWTTQLAACRAVLAQERLLPKKQLKSVLAFMDALEAADIYDLQEAYVETFDRGRSHSLHLFEHIHGESRDRGQAMVDLAGVYAEKGFFIDQAELPDYIPLFLEFLSLCPVEEAVGLLGEPIDIMATIAGRLHQRDSAYTALFDALVALSRVKPHPDRVQAALRQQADDTSLEALDKEWEEAAAFAGPPGQADCATCTRPADDLHIKITQ